MIDQDKLEFWAEIHRHDEQEGRRNDDWRAQDQLCELCGARGEDIFTYPAVEGVNKRTGEPLIMRVCDECKDNDCHYINKILHVK